MEDFRQSRNASPAASRNSSNAPSRNHTPLRLLSIATTTSESPHHSRIEHLMNSSPGTVVNVSNSSISGTPVLNSPDDVTISKETSFIKEKKKGTIETV